MDTEKQLMLKKAQDALREAQERLLALETESMTQEIMEELPEELSEKQRKAVVMALNRKSFFLTGEAGTGKTFTLLTIVKFLRKLGLNVSICSMTGISAYPLHGSTIHGWSGLGLGKGSLGTLLKKARSPRSNFHTTDVLICDEASMMSGQYFARLEWMARCVRGDSRPFGGIQLILTGDMAQLPPVPERRGPAPFLLFETRAFRRCVPYIVRLDQIYRTNDETLAKGLASLRRGERDEAAQKMLQVVQVPWEERAYQKPTFLRPRRVDVGEINKKELEALPGPIYHYKSTDSGSYPHLLDACPAAKDLYLKEGAVVLLLHNFDTQRGLVNGARGVVRSFWEDAAGKPWPVVEFDCGHTMTMHEIEFGQTFLVGRHPNIREVSLAKRVQVPLCLAYALTVHKSQGMSLDWVDVDLRNVFSSGQAYVALSRAKTLQGLHVRNLEGSDLFQQDKRVLFFIDEVERKELQWPSDRPYPWQSELDPELEPVRGQNPRDLADDERANRNWTCADERGEEKLKRYL